MRRLALIYFIFMSFMSAGCVPVLLGAGAAAGYMVSNDSAAGNVTGSYRDVWDIALDVLNAQEAEVTSAIESSGVIKALLADDVGVTVKISNIDSETQRIKVSARKCYLPKPEFAQKIFFKITKELE